MQPLPAAAAPRSYRASASFGILSFSPCPADIPPMKQLGYSNNKTLPGDQDRTMADMTLDTKGLNCPLPILKTKKVIKDLPPGATLEVLATDPGSLADFQAFCKTTGNVLLEQEESGGVFRFLIQHSG